MKSLLFRGGWTARSDGRVGESGPGAAFDVRFAFFSYRRLGFEREDDRVHDGVDVRADRRIREPQDLEPGALEDGVSDPVVFGLGWVVVVAAVEFDDQASVKADEVEVIAVRGALASEVIALDVQALEVGPEPDLRLGHGVAEGSGPGG